MSINGQYRQPDGGDKGDNVFNLLKAAGTFVVVVGIFYAIKVLLGH